MSKKTFGYQTTDEKREKGSSYGVPLLSQEYANTTFSPSNTANEEHSILLKDEQQHKAATSSHYTSENKVVG